MEDLIKKEDFLKLVSSLKHTNVLYNKNDVVILKVWSYDDCNTLFANCSKWCIAKSKCHWDEYVDKHIFNSQFFIINFNENIDDNLSLIGFTTSVSKGMVNVVAAHAKNDIGLLGDFGKIKETYFYKISQEIGIDGVIKKIIIREWLTANGFIIVSLITFGGIVYGFGRICKLFL